MEISGRQPCGACIFRTSGDDAAGSAQAGCPSGAMYSFSLGRWFPGFPPQLDVLSSIFGGGIAGAYAEGTLAALLGTTCLVGVVLARRRMRSNTSMERTRER